MIKAATLKVVFGALLLISICFEIAGITFYPMITFPKFKKKQEYASNCKYSSKKSESIEVMKKIKPEDKRFYFFYLQSQCSSDSIKINLDVIKAKKINSAIFP